MGLVTLYIAVGFFFAWRFFVDMDALKPEDMKEVVKQVPLAPEIMSSMRPVVAIALTLIWPYFAAQDLWQYTLYVGSIPSRIYMKISTWIYVRRFRRWYDEVTDHLVFFEVEPEEFFAIVPPKDLSEMFDQGFLPLYPVKCYVRTVRDACTQFAREAEGIEQSAKEAA